LRPATLKLELEGDGQTRRVPVPKVFPCHEKIVHWLDREWVQGQRSHINHDLFRLSLSTQWITMEKAKRRLPQGRPDLRTTWRTQVYEVVYNSTSQIFYRKTLYRLVSPHMDHVVQLKGKSIGTDIAAIIANLTRSPANSLTDSHAVHGVREQSFTYRNNRRWIRTLLDWPKQIKNRLFYIIVSRKLDNDWLMQRQVGPLGRLTIFKNSIESPGNLVGQWHLNFLLLISK
jgi:hypothetical protein